MDKIRMTELKKRIDRNLGIRLQILRNKKGISQKVLGEQINCSDTAISNYEKGVRPIPANLLYLISSVCDEVPNFFFKDEIEIMQECKDLQKSLIAEYSVSKEKSMKNYTFGFSTPISAGSKRKIQYTSIEPDTYRVIDMVVVLSKYASKEISANLKDGLLQKIDVNNYETRRTIF